MRNFSPLLTLHRGRASIARTARRPHAIASQSLSTPAIETKNPKPPHQTAEVFKHQSAVAISTMGKKKSKGEYNDYLDGEKLRDNAEIRTSLQASAPVERDVSPPATRQERKGNKAKGRGGHKKPQLTHFLCLPLVTDTSRPLLRLGLEKLKEDLGRENSVPTKAVRPVGTLHLTLGVMSLDKQRLEEATQYLQALDLSSLFRDINTQTLAQQAAETGALAENFCPATLPDPKPLTVNLESLIPMQTPAKTSILYAEPRDASQRLYPFAAALRDRFTAQGYMLEDTRPLRLHATIVNTIYAKPAGQRGRKSTKLKNTLRHIEHKVSPHHHTDEVDGQDDGSSHEENGNDTPQVNNHSKLEGHGPGANSWMRFDARPLIESYKDFIWAESVRVDTVRICRMGARKIWSGEVEGEGEVVDEEYEVVAERSIFS